jgi:hypothetical protein
MRPALRILLSFALLAPSGPIVALPSLPEAFGPGVAGVDGVAPGHDLLRIDVPAERYPDARCADGSSVPLFVRRAASAAHRDDWIVYLQGGGSCGNGQSCYARWRGRDGNFGANKLSNRFAPRGGMQGHGIFSRAARNPFAGWNQVFVYYCSSDGWSGRTRDRETVARLEDGREVAYRLNLLGAHIVDAVFDLLHADDAPVAYRSADGTETLLPPLSRAQHVLFAGSSAGGGGVLRNADRVRDGLRERRGCAPAQPECGPAFAAVVDGTLGLERAGLDHGEADVCGGLLPCTYDASMQLRWNQVVRAFWDGVGDASCLAHQPAAEAWRCGDGEVLAKHHVTTPMFARSDLQDSLVMGNTLEAGFGLDGAPLDRLRYGQALELQLLELAAGLDRIEPAPRPVGVFAPQCGQHVGLDNERASHRHAVVDEAGTRHVLLESLAAWLRGEDVAVVQAFETGGAPPGCAR